VKNIKSENESNIYDKVLNYFRDKDKKDKQSIDTWQDISYLNLMKCLKLDPTEENYKVVVNAIILILALFHTDSLDIYSVMGKDLGSINGENKTQILNSLKKSII